MRCLALAIIFSVCAAVPAIYAADPMEEDALKLIRQLGGKGAVDDRLDAGAQVSATFETGSDTLLTNLSKFPAIGSITLNDSSKCTEKGFASLKELPNLQKLVLGKCTVTDKSSLILGSIKPIGLLYLGESKITDAGLVGYGKLKHLKVLDLYETKITDKGLAHLVGMPKIEELNLSGTKVTDRGIVHLKELKTLKLLRLNRTDVTRDGISNLEKELPKATIRW